MNNIADQLFKVFWYFANLTETGNALNKYLVGLPTEVQEHLIGLGEWIKTLFGWG